MDPVLPSKPHRGQEFSFGTIEQSGSVAAFSFRCSRFGEFTETVDFGEDKEAPPELLRLLQIALGVSSYKAAAAEKIVFPPLSAGGRAMAEALYTQGMAEFFVRSGLPYPASIEFDGDLIDAPAGQLNFQGQPLVAFGGGKDSYVAGKILEKASGEPVRYASVVLGPAVEAVLTATAPSKPLFIQRRLDPRLPGLKDAFSGHVPITAINMLTMVIAGHLRGSGPIIFANERSADEPTMVGDGFSANHQYSKSSDFEDKIRRAIAEAAPGAPAVYSALRPFSELWIGQQFATIKEAFPRFTSCNRNFRLAGDAEQRWCGTCPKCAFTSLILSPFLSREEAQTAFGRVMLDLEALWPHYRELCGLTEQKPWECVGTIAECQAALWKLAQGTEWRETRLVQDLYPELLAIKSERELASQWQDALKPEGRGALPDRVYETAVAL